MKAQLLKKWNEMVLTDLEKPVANPGEAVIRVRYAGVCGSDISVYTGKHPTATAPVVIGHEILGYVESVNGESDIAVGDMVTVDPLISCGVCPACGRGDRHVCKSLKLLGIHENGGYAEYTKASLDKIVKIPAGLSEKLAALSEPFAVGAHVTARAGMKPGDRVLVIGGGPIGIIVALCAKERGASVHVSEPNEKRRSLAEKLGIDCLDPTSPDFKEKLNGIIGDDAFDIVIEASGSKPGILMTTEVCRIGGVIVPMALSGAPVEFILGRVSFKEQTVVGSRVYTHEHFIDGVNLLAGIAKKLNLDPLVSDILPLGEANTAIEMMMTGKNAGKILIDCE